MKVDVGLYLCGDAAGSALAAELCALQEENDGAVVKHWSHEAAHAMQAEQPAPTKAPQGIQLVGHIDELFDDLLKKPHPKSPLDAKLAATLQAVSEIEERLGQLAGGEKPIR
jgi:hypothetical protein